ncbi:MULTISPECIES: TIGR03503 family protein [unclassified Shewanella]|uniref:TIGR03503 family protein n=1 Tax=unclassified Shewanella TaxID=196818 RepID=UPI000C8150F5|nr:MULTISPECIES: TIGR03503 family protein [unclassified Shewanella]MDO6618070.1 TIGR03503 family protein [Shewanella sp. 6_MG-2023]MDO6638342.1 TIGR03503 family protein [Shewanella sp. 5_MG-2023]PMG43492.1 TIGR03503 family protein [Shewanella sp. 10N.286.52.B9]PMI00527.1 TIGR03503 family protein [Shewanella sp. 10N.286.48.A6]
MKSYCLAVIFILVATVTPQLATAVPYTQASELQNRFRIDHMVDEVTLLVQRTYGSAPVIIVLPDGSKWYSERHPDNVNWADGLTGDMIKINNPMPGPWQLIGSLAPNSTIQKVSQLEIDVEHIPQPLFQGERLKVTAKLLGDGLTVRLPGLDYMFEWTVKFTSHHKNTEANFTTGTVTVGSYRDNGEGLDEIPDDGVFTGKHNLNQPWGSYTLSVVARNNVFEREISYPIYLSETPIQVEVIEPADKLTGVWQIQINVDDEILKLEQTHIQFDIVGPAGLKLPIVVNELTETPALVAIPQVTDFGSYRIKGSVASTSIAGRELILDLPELFFNLIEPPQPPPSAEELAARAAQLAAQEEQAAKDKAIVWIASINGLLLIIGGVGLIFWRKKLALNKALATTKLRLEQEAAKKGDITAAIDDFDLTMPDEK